MTGIGGEFEKADITSDRHAVRAAFRAGSIEYCGRSANQREHLSEVPYLVDLLGLRDGVFPGVLLLSRRR